MTPVDATPRAVILVALAVMGVGLAMCIARVVRGPSPFDRVLALDCFVLNVLGAILLLSMLLATELFLEAALVIALLGFIGTVSLATYLEVRRVE